MRKKKYPDGGKINKVKKLDYKEPNYSDNIANDKAAFMRQAEGKKQSQTEYSRGTSETFGNLLNNLGSYFLGIDNPGTKPSNYKPTKSKNPNAKYTTWQFLKNDVKDDLTSDIYIQNINTQQDNFVRQNPNYVPTYVKNKNFNDLYSYYENSPKSRGVRGSAINLGQYTVSPGKDDRGRYIGIHDTYDWDFFTPSDGGIEIGATPFETYDRIYEDEWDKIKGKKEGKKMPDGGKIKAVNKNNITNPIDQKVYDWSQSYINSPKYKERLTNFWQYPDYVQRQRAEQIGNTQFREDFSRTAYSDSYEYPNQINVNQNQLDAIKARRDEAIAHELGHGTNASRTNPALRLNPLEERYIFDRNRTLSPDVRQGLIQGAASSKETMSEFLQGPTHDLAPSESKSDIDALRYLMNEQKIYDAGTQDLTPEMLQRAKSNPAINKAFAPKRLFDNFQDKDLIDIMNKVAVNNTQMQPNMAYNGKKMKNGGGLSASKDRGSDKKPYPSVKSSDFAGGDRSYPIPTEADAIDALRLAGLHGRDDVKVKVYKKYPNLKKLADGGQLKDEVIDMSGFLNGGVDFNKLIRERQLQHQDPNFFDGFDYFMQDGYRMIPAMQGNERINLRELKPGEAGYRKNMNNGGRAQYGAVLPEDEELLPIRPNPIQINSGLQNPIPVKRAIGEQWDMQQVGNDPRMINQGLQNPFPTNNPLPIDYNTNNTPSGQLKNNVSNFFRNDPYKNYIPTDASREGPSFYENEYLMNPEDQSVVQSNYTPMKVGTSTQAKKRQGNGINFAINPGQIASGIFGAVNQLYDRNRGIEENARLKRRRAMNQGYNPNQYGTGSQAIYKDGGKLSSEKAKEMLRDGTANGKKLTKKQKGYFGWIAGGRKADNGASITPLSGDMTSTPIVQFNGPSHADGGIPIAYGGKTVEVEGQETAFVDRVGDLNILGNMYVPGTKTKFKAAGKQIAKEEQKVGKQLDKSATLIDESDPYDRFERFTFNSGMMMGANAQRKQAEIEQSKEYLANLQQIMLDAGMGQNSEKAQDGKKLTDSSKKKGYVPFPMRVDRTPIPTTNQFMESFRTPQTVTAEPSYIPIEEELTPTEKALTRQVGSGSMAVRHNNPGNMKFAKWMEKYGAVKGDPGTDGGNFAKFPSLEQGQAAMVNLLNSPTYKNKTVAQAIKTWTGGTPYSKIPDSIKNKKVGDLQGDNFVQLLDTITQGEDSKRYNWTSSGDPVPVGNPAQPPVQADAIPPGLPYNPNLIPYDPNTPGVPQEQPPVTYRPPVAAPGIPDFNIPPRTERLPFRNPLRPGQIAPEVFTFATERPQFVPGQTYEPELYQPYQVSFQDRLNENNASFRAISQQLPGNAAALSTLAGQKYQADSQVLGEEFRVNQGIANEITNKNTQLLNEAKRVNIDLTDQQFVRQTQAEANTRENIRNAMSSVAGKLEQNRTETLRYNAYANLFPQYTFNNAGQSEYIPNEEQWFGNGAAPAQSSNPAQRSRSTYDSSGKLKETVVVDPSEYQRKQMEYDLWKKQMQNKWMISDKVNKRR